MHHVDGEHLDLDGGGIGDTVGIVQPAEFHPLPLDGPAAGRGPVGEDADTLLAIVGRADVDRDTGRSGMVGGCEGERGVRPAVGAGGTILGEQPGSVPVFDLDRALAAVGLFGDFPRRPPGMIPGDVERDRRLAAGGGGGDVPDPDRVGLDGAAESGGRRIVGVGGCHRRHDDCDNEHERADGSVHEAFSTGGDGRCGTGPDAQFRARPALV